MKGASDNEEKSPATKCQDEKNKKPQQRHQGDGDSGSEIQKHEVNSKEHEKLFADTRKPPAIVYAPKLDVVWLVLMGLAAGTRMVNLKYPNSVVFDEVHFGRFTSYFMQRKFFFDVHPPLGKLLFALTAYLTGFDGRFMFEEIGRTFGEHADQIWYLRATSAAFSILLVPCIYEILLELGCTYFMAIFGAVLVIFENMLVVQGRFILMDSMLVFFIALSVCCYLKFLREHKRPFRLKWWVYLFSLGLALTGAFSVKYNGLLTLMLIGAFTFLDIWRLIGDVTVSVKGIWQHFIARAGCLFVMPVLLYLLQFYVLFTILTETGPHDDHMSSAFQRTLKGGLAKITENQSQEVAYGSQITLRNINMKQCWLHSHSHLYPVKYPDGRGSSAQQQVTCYPFKDMNNWWIVKRPDSDGLQVDFPPQPVMNGDIIHLVHGTTGRGLNSHDVASPLNAYNMEVSGYIDHNVSMSAQLGWKLQILNPDPSNIWRVIESQIRLVHVNTSASMQVTGGILPEWGFKQYEVATGKIVETEESIWNAEEHNQNISIPAGIDPEEAKRKLKRNTSIPVSSMPFFTKFFELQTRMLRVNSELQQEHTFASRPFDWPLMRKGIAYWLNGTSNAQIFCIGNPAVWWAGSLAVIGYCALLVFYLLRRRRACYDISAGQWQLYIFIGFLIIGGYFLHYFPFFIMERTLFVHHYLPALTFQLLLIPLLSDHIHQCILRNYPKLQMAFAAVCLTYAVIVALVFKYFSAFVYGTPTLTAAEIYHRKWLSTWAFLSHSNT
eukprot:gene15859-17457_t